jgi:hypothetical protein
MSVIRIADGDNFLEKLYCSLRVALDEELETYDADHEPKREFFERALRKVISDDGALNLRDDFKIGEEDKPFHYFYLGLLVAQCFREIGTELNIQMTIEPEKLQ